MKAPNSLKLFSKTQKTRLKAMLSISFLAMEVKIAHSTTHATTPRYEVLNTITDEDDCMKATLMENLSINAQTNYSVSALTSLLFRREG
jgi:hypothetical protein